MVEVIASRNEDTMFVEMDFEPYYQEVNVLHNHPRDSLWMLEEGQVLCLLYEDGSVKDGGFKCYLCGGGWHSDYTTLELPIEGTIAICPKGWGCNR